MACNSAQEKGETKEIAGQALPNSEKVDSKEYVIFDTDVGGDVDNFRANIGIYQ
ncbi:MAG: hypothetical protein WD431_03630 [Cyclobacteriaceae bacterium]